MLQFLKLPSEGTYVIYSHISLARASDIAKHDVKDDENKIVFQKREQVLMRNSTTYFSGDLQTRPYTSRSSVISLSPFPTASSCCCCHTSFFLIPLLPQDFCKVAPLSWNTFPQTSIGSPDCFLQSFTPTSASS